MKLIFFGTPQIAAEHLQALFDSPENEVLALVCQPDKPRGRGQTLEPCASKALALRHDSTLPILQPTSLRDEAFKETFKRLGAELGVSVAYGRIIPADVFSMPKAGCINVHFSLLPRLRGPSPLEYTILEGHNETGCTTFLLEKEMDTGPMLMQETVPVLPRETAPQLGVRLTAIGIRLMLRSIALIAKDKAPKLPQNHTLATYCKMIRKEDGNIDWSKPAAATERMIRAFIRWPKAKATLYGQRLSILEAQVVADSSADEPGTITGLVKERGFVVKCGSESLLVTQVQPEGKKPMSAWSFVQGQRSHR
ncbi:MAG: methionyl-tRNA formyltransferase [Elusimicrobiota bacterium]